MADDLYTEEEVQDVVKQFNSDKQSVHSFFNNIIKTKSTTKTGNLEKDELGMPRLPLRSIKELQLFSEDIYNQDSWRDYFEKLGEILTSTSLSKDAKLLELAVTQKRSSQIADVSRPKKENKGWFKKKDGQE